MTSIPTGNVISLDWMRKHPEVVQAAFERLHQLDRMELRVVPAQTANQGRIPGVFSKTNLVMPIPVGLNRAIPLPTAYAGGTANTNYSATQVQGLMDNLNTYSATLNLLMQEMKAANLMPQ